MASLTPGGFAGYLNVGIKNSTKNIIPVRTSAFFLLSEPANEFLLYTKTIPNNADSDIPYIVLATTSPPFCHPRYGINIFTRINSPLRLNFYSLINKGFYYNLIN